MKKIKAFDLNTAELNFKNGFKKTDEELIKEKCAEILKRISKNN